MLTLLALLTAMTSVQAPERFLVRLETTRGPIVIECVRDWAPLGADRFYELVTSGYYDDAAIDQGLADNSPEMVEAVRTELEPSYGDWAMFAEWLPLNIEGLLRIWAETGATGATPAP